MRDPELGRYWRTRRNRRSFIAGAGGVATGAAGFALVGCGGDDDDDASPTATTAAGSTPQPSATSADAGASPTAANGREMGGTLRYPLEGLSSGEPPTLYPFESVSFLTQHPSALHYSRLMRAVAGPDASPSDFTQLTGDLAAAVPEQPDDLTYVFTLKPNITFHDKPPMDGRPATAEDFAQTYDAFLTASPNAGVFEGVVERVEATGEHTLTVTLRDVYAPFLLTHGASPEGVWFVPVELIQSGNAANDPVGTGPFVFRDWEPGVALRWDRHPTFHDGPVPYFDGVEASLNNDAQRILTSLESGDLDLSELSSLVYDEATSRLDGNDIIWPSPRLGGFFFNFDNDDARWRDKRVRQALSMAMDRDGYLATLDQTGQGDWASHISASLVPYYVSPRDQEAFGPNARNFHFNPTEAKALLQEATGSDTIDFVITANVDVYGPEFEALWQTIATQLAEVGFNAELRFQEYNAYQQTTYKGDIASGVGLGPFLGSAADPNDVFSRVYESSSARHNWGGTPIEEQTRIDEMIVAQRRILDLDERVAYVQDMQRELADSMLIIPYTSPAGYTFTQPWVQGYHHKLGYGVHRESMAEASFTPDRIARG